MMSQPAPAAVVSLAPVPSTARRWLPSAARTAGSALLFALLFQLVPAGRIWTEARKMPPATMAAMTFVYLLVHLAGACKWHLLVNLERRLLRLATSVECYFAGLFWNIVTPSIIGGDAVAMALGMRYSPSRLPVAMGAVLNRVVDLSAVALLAVLGARLLPARSARGGEVLSESLLVSFGILAAVAALWGGMLALRVPSRWRERLTALRDFRDGVRRRPQRVLGAFAISAVMQLAFVGMGVWIGKVCGLRMSAALWLFAWPASKLAAVLPFTVGGFGARELAFAGLVGTFSVAPALGAAVSLLFGCIVLIGNLLSGPLSLLLRRASL